MLIIQRIADLSNILARVVDLACNLVRILDCEFILELLADSNLDKTFGGSRILLQIWAGRRTCIPLFTHPTPFNLSVSKRSVLFRLSAIKCNFLFNHFSQLIRGVNTHLISLVSLLNLFNDTLFVLCIVKTQLYS